jgi:hypothetical protein
MWKKTEFQNPLSTVDRRWSRHTTHGTWSSGCGGAWEVVEGRDFFGTELRDVEETYATEFAAEMLMPRPALVEIADNPTVAALAAKFGVTGEIMRFRLDQIGWRG